nr:hypothetical protein [Rhodothermus marinus]
MARTFVQFGRGIFQQENPFRIKMPAQLVGRHHPARIGWAAAGVALGALLGTKPLGDQVATGAQDAMDQRIEGRARLGRQVQKSDHHGVPGVVRLPSRDVGLDRFDGDALLRGQSVRFFQPGLGVIDGRHLEAPARQPDGIAALTRAQLDHLGTGPEVAWRCFGHEGVGLGAVEKRRLRKALIPEFRAHRSAVR